jgi:hypothetical protein
VSDPPAIGGYFELELPACGAFPYPETLRFQSARAAFATLLEATRPVAAWVPALICDSMLLPLWRAGLPTKFYAVDARFEIEAGVQVQPDEILLYVDHFGVCRGAEDSVLQRFASERVVLDHAQSFYSAPRDCVATIFSPRKFFGIPDGGLLATQRNVELPSEEDSGSLERCEHLLRRHDGTPADGYAAFRRAEDSLDDVAPRRMSKLTSRLLRSVDFEAARKRRIANFEFLHARLAGMNQLALDVRKLDGPLCYPLLLAKPGMRDRLLAENVFVPTYWREVLDRVPAGSFEAQWVERGLPLPCDQRYEIVDLERIVEILQSK